MLIISLWWLSGEIKHMHIIFNRFKADELSFEIAKFKNFTFLILKFMQIFFQNLWGKSWIPKLKFSPLLLLLNMQVKKTALWSPVPFFSFLRIIFLIASQIKSSQSGMERVAVKLFDVRWRMKFKGHRLCIESESIHTCPKLTHHDSISWSM